jgi:Transcriptional regulators
MPTKNTAKRGEKKSRRSDAYQQILLAIIFGDLPPGSGVDDKRLAEQFGLGLAVVRDALARLALEGLVERHARIGTRIPDLSLREMQEVFEARVVMEGAAAALAAERATPKELAKLRDAFAGIEASIGERDYRTVVLMDQDFHMQLAAMTKNGHMERSIRQLHSNALRFWYFGLTRLNPAIVLQDIKTHLAVADAIEQRDPKAAAAAMRAVIGVFPDNMRFFMAGSDALQQALHSDDLTPVGHVLAD